MRCRLELASGPAQLPLDRPRGGGATVGLASSWRHGRGGRPQCKSRGRSADQPSGHPLTFRNSPLWWWLDGGCWPWCWGAVRAGLRRRVQAALFGESPSRAAAPRIDDRGRGSHRAAAACRGYAAAPTVGRAVEWVEAFRSPRGQTHVAWLSLSDGASLLPREGRHDPRRRPRLRHLHRFGGGSPAAVSSAPGPDADPGVSPRCRLVRDAGSGQLLVYPVDGMTVDRNGQRLNSPTYVFDQDELQIGEPIPLFQTRTR